MPIVGANSTPIPGQPISPDDPWIQTYSGVEFHPLSPRIVDIHIEDIAHGLSHICRFAGHVRKFYSVAEHSVRVSYEVERLGGPALALEGLLHDATEAYIVDIPSPIKKSRHLAGYRDVEVALDMAIRNRFRLPACESAAVRAADLTLLATEARDLLGPAPRTWQHRPAPLPDTIEPWSPEMARDIFLNRYARIMENDPRAALGVCGCCAGPIRLGGAPLVRGLWGAFCAACGGDLRITELGAL
jgi:hypothetical protein